jgi:hypothetical protein
LKQGPLDRIKPSKKPRPVPDAAAIQSASRHVAKISEEPLRQALIRLGAHVLASESRGSDKRD